MKPVQYFSDEYLESCKKMTPMEILEFLENFKILTTQGAEHREKSKLISMKIPPSLLKAFKTQCELKGVPYQAQIKKLMVQWLKE